ncbi:cytochrome c family protein, putative [Roseibacterium elongatum DSM 19469]|uniref:Cytochrome c family protein, putative n=1 Tax=Roseicyclus elongatus DSM 19469 TaxID=1294273 RepID=W8S8S8_9RHOB|nr:cytochrome c [Roseibacterium elongatum]AHM05376.1 cytochrome c family protein, putative [Roseibacterium elongatum DSM 19469]
MSARFAVAAGTAMLSLGAPALAQDAERGARLYAEHCAVCHGAGLRGDGPMAEVLLVSPPDLTGIAARYDGTFPRAGVAWRIDGRDPILSHGGDMPLFGFVFSEMSEVLRSEGGQTVVTSAEVLDLISFLEANQR